MPSVNYPDIITANLYSHLEYNAKVTSAETIARVLGGKKESPAYTDEPETKKSDSRKTKNDTITDTSQAAAV